VQDAHNGDDHHPAGLIRLAAVAAALIAATAAQAAEPRFVALPSPLTPLTASPPIGGGASAGGEGHPHRVLATIRVRVSLDKSGRPFALRATQQLDVRRIGDYAFTIGAPLTGLTTAPGSTAPPGLRTGAYLWQGFNPGRRILAATIDLEQRAADALPLRVDVSGGRVRLTNATAVDVAAYRADGNEAQLRAYLASLRAAARRGEPATGGGATITSALQDVELRISAPLAIEGTIGTKHLRLTLGGAGNPETAAFPEGPVHLTVRPLPPLELLSPPADESGRALFSRATRASLESARSRQYDTFLGNPDPAGPSHGTYVYLTTRKPRPLATAITAPSNDRNWLRLLLIVAAAIAAAAVAVVAWSRA
jgi:hypothetical protein